MHTYVYDMCCSCLVVVLRYCPYKWLPCSSEAGKVKNPPCKCRETPVH